MCLVFRKLGCPFGQVKTKMYLPKSPFFKSSLAGASGQVLMSVADDKQSAPFVRKIKGDAFHPLMLTVA